MRKLERIVAGVMEDVQKAPLDEITEQGKERFTKKLDDVKESISALKSDKWVYRLVVIFLGLAIIGGLTATFFLSMEKLDVPEIFLAIGSAGVGALAGLLAPSPAGNG